MIKNGQATVELAIFGSVLIFCLGLLINYGMYYNLSQMHQMRAFRKTLARANDETVREGSLYANCVTVYDKHIPDPPHQSSVI